MDSQGFNQTTIQLANASSPNGGNSIVDLTLKLGLPIGEDENNPQIGLMFHSISFNLHGSQGQIQNTYELANGGNGWRTRRQRGVVVYYQFIDDTKIGSIYEANSTQESASLNQNSMVANFHGRPSSSTPNSIADNLNLGLAPPVEAINNNHVHDQRAGETNLRSRASRRQSEPHIRCTNIHCNTNDTPTLCNACGIRYRKQEKRRLEQTVNEENNGANC
ncbi:hypothetical protein K2173_014947 [Erythroxylum novogranatense]|uniref:GATA-type domain-containing protein n=1 Tax=Erythroxylum novogranatense TaxID=1862640 RepID=A0AAV8TTP1_9ROSI|nr:hypothetical protein K2173_014947 [Erythroxylum novogranatense]